METGRQGRSGNREWRTGVQVALGEWKTSENQVVLVVQNSDHKTAEAKPHCIILYLIFKILLCFTDYSCNFISCIVCLFFFPELNRCHLDLSEINRLIQRLQALEVGQAFTNGDLQRIISIQVACWWVWDCSFHSASSVGQNHNKKRW